MEVVTGSCHAVFPVGDATGVGAARRHAAALANNLGLDDVASGRLALVVTELGSNLAKHARGGRLLIASRSYNNARHEVEVLSLDTGPGMANIDQCMADGFSTAGTPGTGLGAAKRLADDFELYSSVPDGTVAVARVRNRPQAPGESPPYSFRVGVVAIAAPGETLCGDGWVAVLRGGQAALMMADGLGHGPLAAEAAQAAAKVFAQQPFAEPCAMLEAIHVSLRMTRGAAVFTGLLDAQASTIRYAGAGNVMARVVSGVADRTLLTQHGTAGLQLRRVEETRVDWPPHASVVVYSDGILTRWKQQAITPLLGRDPALSAGLLVRDYCRGRDDATVLIIRRKD